MTANQTYAWTWVSPVPLDPEPLYAVMKWKGGALYAGPADTAQSFPPHLVDESSIRLCPRSEALRVAVESRVIA